MPKNESEFKSEVREDIKSQYGADVDVWTNNDMFRSGLPDFNIVWRDKNAFGQRGIFIPCEAKFAKKLPVRGKSLLPGVDLTGIQGEFLDNMQKLSIPSLVLIGFEDVAVACPFKLWPRKDSAGLQVPVNNVSLDFVIGLKKLGYAFPKTRSGWALNFFLEKITGNF